MNMLRCMVLYKSGKCGYLWYTKLVNVDEIVNARMCAGCVFCFKIHHF